VAAKPPVPETGSDWKEWLLKCSRAINGILKGQLNTGGLVTLSANVASTTITDARISVDSTFVLVPTTANAAAELGAGTLYMSETGRVNGAIVITHANNAQTDRTYRIVVLG
jgi:hypothetical protein